MSEVLITSRYGPAVGGHKKLGAASRIGMRCNLPRSLLCFLPLKRTTWWVGLRSLWGKGLHARLQTKYKSRQMSIKTNWESGWTERGQTICRKPRLANTKDKIRRRPWHPGNSEEVELLYMFCKNWKKESTGPQSFKDLVGTPPLCVTELDVLWVGGDECHCIISLGPLAWLELQDRLWTQPQTAPLPGGGTLGFGIGKGGGVQSQSLKVICFDNNCYWRQYN